MTLVDWSCHETYDAATVDAEAPHTGGVYVLWVKLKDKDEWRCFYVGKADDLHDRLLDHLAEEEPNECIAAKIKDKVCGFFFAEVAKAVVRSGIEKFLFDHYEPECNEQDPGGKPAQVNLPS